MRRTDWRSAASASGTPTTGTACRSPRASPTSLSAPASRTTTPPPKSTACSRRSSTFRRSEQPHGNLSRVRRLGVIALTLLLFLHASGDAAQSAARAGVFTGYAFDACRAPSTAALQAWTASPYRALGIYIGGVNRACKNQANLTPAWVQQVTSTGWSLLPLYVGQQAPCIGQ